MPKYKTLFFFLSLICAGACQDFGSKYPKNEEIRLKQNPNPKTSTIAVHREFLKREQESIKNYIADRNLDMQRNGTGIYYQIEGDANVKNSLKIKSGDDVRYHYIISLLNGSELYRSSADEPAILRVDKEDAEIGLHDALKLMSLGDKGLFILPSHRAFGVSGDQNKIPPFTALVYDLEIVEIQKLQNP